jgi:hypothetical protein
VRWPGSTPFELSLSKPCSFSISRLFDESGAALSPRRATYCSFASPKESRQRKGDPGVCLGFWGQSPNSPSLWLALRVRCECTAAKSVSDPNNLPAVLGPAGVELELGYRLRQSLALIRLALRSSAHTQGFCGTGPDSGSESVAYRAAATIFIAACARITWARGQKHLRNRRAAWFLGADRNFAATHSQGATKARRIWALHPKTSDSAPESASKSAPESDFISTAVWQSRAAQRQADQGERLSEPQASSSSTPPAASSAGNRVATLTSARLFFAYFLLAKQKNSRSPAAATERHRNSAMNSRLRYLSPNRGSRSKPTSPTPC